MSRHYSDMTPEERSIESLREDLRELMAGSDIPLDATCSGCRWFYPGSPGSTCTTFRCIPTVATHVCGHGPGYVGVYAYSLACSNWEHRDG